MTIEVRAPEAAAGGTGKKGDRGRAAVRNRRAWVWQGLSLLLAFVGAGFVLVFAGGLSGEEDSVRTVVSPAVVEPQLLPETTASFDPEALRGRIEEITEGREGSYGVAVLEPVSGEGVSLRGDEEFMSASIGKLPVFAALYRAAARGELDLEEEISVLSEDYQDGSGGLQAFPEGHSLSLRECAYRLVNHSDNTAWAMLNRYLGEDKIRAELEEMGIRNSRYADNLGGYFTTPDDVLLLLEKISDANFTSEELSREMLEAMTDTSLEDRIPEKLPPDVRVAHKTGSYGDSFGDAGVVFYGDQGGAFRHYYLVVLARSAGEYEARDVIQDISLAVYEALTGHRVDPAWSREKATRLESPIVELPADSPDSIVEDPGGHVENAESNPALEETPPENEKSWPERNKPVAEAWRKAEPPPEGRYDAATYQSSEPYSDPYAWEQVDAWGYYEGYPEGDAYPEETGY